MKVLPCPHCHYFNLEVHATLELPPTDGADEITLYALACPTLCASHFFGISKERHFPEDEVDTFAFQIKNEASWHNLLATFRSCKTPSDKNCPCHTHGLFKNAFQQKIYEVPGVQLLDTPVPLQWKDKKEFPYLEEDLPPYWP